MSESEKEHVAMDNLNHDPEDGARNDWLENEIKWIFDCLQSYLDESGESEVSITAEREGDTIRVLYGDGSQQTIQIS